MTTVVQFVTRKCNKVAFLILKLVVQFFEADPTTEGVPEPWPVQDPDPGSELVDTTEADLDADMTASAASLGSNPTSKAHSSPVNSVLRQDAGVESGVCAFGRG